MTTSSIARGTVDDPFIQGLYRLTGAAHSEQVRADQRQAMLTQARRLRVAEIVDHTRRRFRALEEASPSLGAQVEYTCDAPAEEDSLPVTHTLRWRTPQVDRKLEIMVSAQTGRYWFRAVAGASWLTPAQLPVDEHGSDILAITTDHIDRLICVLADAAAWNDSQNSPTGIA